MAANILAPVSSNPSTTMEGPTNCSEISSEGFSSIRSSINLKSESLKILKRSKTQLWQTKHLDRGIPLLPGKG